LSHAAKLLGKRPRLLLHGGGADTLTVEDASVELRPALVLEGLARWAGQERAA
jgi:type III pantothenate kinase